MATLRNLRLPGWRKTWGHVHWFVGITAGTVLMMIGLTGAVLSFREEIIDGLNPGGRQVMPRADTPALAPPALLQAVRIAFPERPVGTLAVFAAPGVAARLVFAPRTGEPRGETVYLDPYTGTALAPLKGARFFEWTESLHRWLLLPREAGRMATGTVAAALLLLSLSGLYLRWPRRVLDWRTWFTFDPALTGRAFLRSLHTVLGTCVLPLYVVSASSGLYWGFDAVRDRVDAWVGEARMSGRKADSPASAKTQRTRALPRADAGAHDIAAAWRAFEARAAVTGGWSEVILRVPAGDAPSVLFTWLDASPAHERARNRMSVRLPDGGVTHDDRHDAKTAGGRFVAAIYPLHVGSYFGLPGRVLMTLAALMLPVLGITGWLLYLDRRAKVARRDEGRRLKVAVDRR